MHWIQQRRKTLGMNQEELSAKLQLGGFDISRTTISNWENHVSTPPLENPRFVRALANALRLSMADLLNAAGYGIGSDAHSETARRAADILDQLSPDRQRLAMTLLEQFLEEAAN